MDPVGANVAPAVAPVAEVDWEDVMDGEMEVNSVTAPLAPFVAEGMGMDSVGVNVTPDYAPVAGMGWVLPAMPLIRWMSRPD